jgi:aspartate aminotransferase
VCYSYSKSFSLPGERIGYFLIPSEIADFAKILVLLPGRPGWNAM